MSEGDWIPEVILFTRYAIYFTPAGPLADAGAAWLGWDSAQGCDMSQPSVPGLDMAAITQRPRKYGFHATVKAPFALARGQSEAALRAHFSTLCAALSPVSVPRLAVRTLGSFMALVPSAGSEALRDLAAQTVRDLDAFRAPLTEAELTRRKKARLSPQQEALLLRWGYPHVMDSFNFHMTLTGRIERAQLEGISTAAIDFFAPVLDPDFTVDALTLMGERADGMFVALARHGLGVQGACTLHGGP